MLSWHGILPCHVFLTTWHGFCVRPGPQLPRSTGRFRARYRLAPSESSRKRLDADVRLLMEPSCMLLLDKRKVQEVHLDYCHKKLWACRAHSA